MHCGICPGKKRRLVAEYRIRTLTLKEKVHLTLCKIQRNKCTFSIWKIILLSDLYYILSDPGEYCGNPQSGQFQAEPEIQAVSRTGFP